MQPESAETLLKRYAKRNFWLNVLDGVAFVFGISMVSRYTVLPLFVSRLSSERWLRGLLPTLTQVGAPLPALYMAPLSAKTARMQPDVTCSWWSRCLHRRCSAASSGSPPRRHDDQRH